MENIKIEINTIAA